MDTVVVVKHKVLVEGRSRRETAKELKISRNTVRRYLDGAQPGVRAEPVRERPVADLVEQRLLAILEESQQWTSGKQQLTARRLHEMVLKEDMACGYTLVKNFVARWKNKRREVFVPLVWAAGDAAEVDFFEVLVDLDGTRRKAWMFVMRLMHSGRDFAWLYQWQDQACFLDGHVRAFAHFAGAPARVLYDNLKAAVARILVGSERELTRRFAAMASRYVVEPCFARPATGHDKGGVESRGKHIRRQLLVPIPAGRTLLEINQTLLAGLDGQMDRKRDAAGESVRERFVREGLHGLPPRPFEPATTVTVEASGSALCKVKGATYSVSTTWARQSLLAHVGADTVTFVGPEHVRVARVRLESGKRYVDYRDYLDELRRKPQALRQVAAVLCQQLGEPFGVLWTHLTDCKEPKDAARALAKVLVVLDELGESETKRRISMALDSRLEFPGCLLPKATPEAPNHHLVPETLRSHSIELSRAADYDQLLRGAA